MEEKIELEDLPGVGEKVAEKLRSVGFDDVMAIATCSAGELARVAEVGEATASKIIAGAREKLKMGFETADALDKRRQEIKKLTTCSNNLNELFAGGIESQAITEFHGAWGSGKSQLVFQLSVAVQLPKEQGGLEGKCLFIDSEGTFRPERVKQMAAGLGLDTEEALKNILIGRAYNSDHQMLLVEKASETIEKNNVKLLIIDSLTSHFRSDYSGRGELAPRQQKLNRHLHALQRMADIYNMPVVVTNQVMAKPDMLFGDPTIAIGGHIVGHQATYRVYMRRSRENKRVCKLIDSPCLPDGETIITVTEEGIRDP